MTKVNKVGVSIRNVRLSVRNVRPLLTQELVGACAPLDLQTY